MLARSLVVLIVLPTAALAEKPAPHPDAPALRRSSSSPPRPSSTPSASTPPPASRSKRSSPPSPTRRCAATPRSSCRTWRRPPPGTAHDRVLLAEIKRLGGKATLENGAPAWLRKIVADEDLAVFARIVEIYLNERTDGHKPAEPKKLADRVTDAWLEHLAGQDSCAGWNCPARPSPARA